MNRTLTLMAAALLAAGTLAACDDAEEQRVGDRTQTQPAGQAGTTAAPATPPAGTTTPPSGGGTGATATTPPAGAGGTGGAPGTAPQR